MRFLLRNWHLKLSAVLLATVLYTGIVFSGAFDEATIQVRIEQVNQPANSYVLTGDLGYVHVRYQTTQELLGNVVAEAAFVARVDLSSYDMDDAPAPQVTLRPDRLLVVVTKYDLLDSKVLANRIVPQLEAQAEPALDHDGSTNALIRLYRKLRRG